MIQKLKFSIKQILYDLTTGLIFRPLIIVICFALLEMILVKLEYSRLISLDLVRWMPWCFAGEASAAELVLGTIAGSVMTVTSIVFSILAMALSLASMQFSPRILNTFMTDKICQNVMGIFIGTFTYCLLLLRTIRNGPELLVPDASVTIGICLALISMGYLIYFIHHMSKFIQVNYIFDHIAIDTEHVIDSVFPEKAIGDEILDEPVRVPDDALPVYPGKSGYIQLIDDESLTWIAKKYGVKIFIELPVGGYAINHMPLIYISPREKVTEELKHICIEDIDIGPIRTMQQDVGFGIRQIVDIALKAISPAVNDPTTAVTAIDQLTRILSNIIQRHIVPWEVKDPVTGELLVSIKRINFNEIIDLSFTQIRQYGKEDMAVSLALMQSINGLIRITKNKEYQKYLLFHANLVCENAKARLSEVESKDILVLKEKIEKYISIKDRT